MRIAPALVLEGLSRKKQLTIVTVLLGAWAAYEFAECVLADDFTLIAYLAMAAGGIAVVVAILKDWRKGVYAFVGWLLFEDFVRKFLGNNMAIYFAKDFLALLVYISFVAALRRKEVVTFRPPFLGALAVFVWFGLIQIFNPGSSSIWFGLMGFKMFFYYVPLLFVGYAFVDSEAQLRLFFRVNLILALIIISLGIAQSIIGPSFLNPEHMADEIDLLSHTYRVASNGSIAYRPTSVFVSTGRYANFVDVAWLLVLGFSGYLLLRLKRGRNLVFIATAVTAAGAFLTASRGTFMWALINLFATSMAFIWGAPWRQKEARHAFRTVQRVALAIGLGIVLTASFYPEAFFSRLSIYEETLLPNSPTSELGHRTWDYPVQNFLGAFGAPHWPYGYGIGTSSLGGQYVVRFFKVKPLEFGVESGFGTLVIEMGIGGLVLWLVMSSGIAISAWRVVKRLKGSPMLPLGFVIFWYALFLLFACTFGGIQPYEDFLLNAYLWLLLGVLFRLPTLSLAPQAPSPAAGERTTPTSFTTPSG